MLLALHHWWQNPYAQAGYAVQEPHTAVADTRTAEAIGFVLFGATGSGMRRLPRVARGTATIRVGALGVGYTIPPAPVRVEEPAPALPDFLPTAGAYGRVRVVFCGAGTGTLAFPRTSDGTARLTVHSAATAGTVAPRWADGHGTWRVRSMGQGTITAPVKRRPWSTPLDRSEMDTVAMIAALYLGDR